MNAESPVHVKSFRWAKPGLEVRLIRNITGGLVFVDECHVGMIMGDKRQLEPVEGRFAYENRFGVARIAEVACVEYRMIERGSLWWKEIVEMLIWRDVSGATRRVPLASVKPGAAFIVGGRHCLGA